MDTCSRDSRDRRRAAAHHVDCCAGPSPAWVVAIAAAVAAALAVGGCQKFDPQPLTPAEVEKVLAPPVAEALKFQAGTFKHPILPPMKVDLADGLSPDEAAVVAVLVNPTLRAVRNKRAVADAQLLQAGLLPNPQLEWSMDVPISRLADGPFIGMGIGPTWDITSLIAHEAKVRVAQASRAAVELDVAWQEWQVAQAAKVQGQALAQGIASFWSKDRTG